MVAGLISLEKEATLINDLLLTDNVS